MYTLYTIQHRNFELLKRTVRSSDVISIFITGLGSPSGDYAFLIFIFSSNSTTN